MPRSKESPRVHMRSAEDLGTSYHPLIFLKFATNAALIMSINAVPCLGSDDVTQTTTSSEQEAGVAMTLSGVGLQFEREDVEMLENSNATVTCSTDWAIISAAIG